MLLTGRSPILIIGALACILWPTAPVHGQAKRRKPQPSTVSQRHVLSPREIAAKVSRSLVLIVTQDKEGEPIASGSGFFYDIRAADATVHLPPGVEFVYEDIATTLHVFKRASQGYIKILGEGVKYKITQIVAIDMQHDLCVFRAAGASGRPLTLATGSNPAVGDDVYVAGNPRGLESTFSKGIISAVRSERGLIQIDAAISAGSSGGPVVNTQAEVVGVAASSLAEGQNLNFAINAAYLASVSHKWDVPVPKVGALALRDREKKRLKGPVRSVTTKIGTYDEVNHRYMEGPPGLPRTTATYDYDGNLTDESHYFGGELTLRRRFEYDERGLLVRRLVSGKLIGETDEAVSEGDAINEKFDNACYSSVSEMTLADKNGRKTVIGEHRYDREGNEVETAYNYDYLQIDGYRTVRTFDRNGWATDETLYAEGKIQSVSRYTYEVDERGNWIKRYSTSYSTHVDQLGFVPAGVVSREIKYYDGR